MSKWTIWHNPRCRKSREGFQYLQSKGIALDIYEYLKEGIDVNTVASLLEKSGEPVERFIRTNEEEYKALGLKGKSLTATEFAELAAEYPKLLQRPIKIKDNEVVLGQPVEKIDELLD